MKNEPGHLGPLPDDWEALAKMLKDNPPVEEKDKCVFCEKETEYPKNMHIDYRSYYVEGCGQLCKVCYDKVYNNPIKN